MNKNREALKGDCSSPSGLSNGSTNENYTTTSTGVKTIDPDGDGDSRKTAMLILSKRGYSNFQSPDWLADNPEGVTESIEVKAKHTFKPPPFFGHGLDVSQANRRMNLLKSKNIRTVLFVIDLDTGQIFSQYLDVLERGLYLDTTGGQRVYTLENFNVITTSATIDKGAVKDGS